MPMAGKKERPIMAVDRTVLRDFLMEHAKNPARVPEAMELLEPLFVNANRGEYHLSGHPEISAAAVALAIANATGNEVKRVAFIALADPFSTPNPDRMGEKVCPRDLRDTLGGDTSFNVWDDLRSVLRNSLWDVLSVGFWNSLPFRFREEMPISFWNSIEDITFFFLGFTILDDAGRIERLKPLIRLIPQAIPLGENTDEPGTWLVLVAYR